MREQPSRQPRSEDSRTRTSQRAASTTGLPPYPARTLRAIDAWDCGESAAEIGLYIFGKQGEDASKEWLRQLSRYWRYHLLF